MYDLVIKNGTIIDGSGDDGYVSDIAISGGRIVCISKSLDGKKIIDASGLTVTPGFIDSHSHADNAMTDYPDMIEKIEQGITTSVAGQCGISQTPIRVGDAYKTFADTVNEVKDIPMGANIMSFVGHGTIRQAVMGFDNRKPTDGEMAQMELLLRNAMESGAVGLSFGLIYSPGCYADTSELTALARIVKEYNGVISAHLRSEAFELEEAVEEFLDVTKATGARAELSHHKAMYKANWGKVKNTLKMVDKAISEGYEVYCDVYPYTASHTTLISTVIPPKRRALDNDGIVELLNDKEMRKIIKEEYSSVYGDDLSYISISQAANHPEYEGRNICEIAKENGEDPFDTAFNIIQECRADVHVLKFVMCEDDVEAVIKHPRAMICTDSSVAKGNAAYHPRQRGSFPRALGRYVRKKGVVPLAEMIRKCTSMPASVYGLKSKGLLKEGYDADICIFNAERIIDRADYSDSTKRCEGLDYVILGGEAVAKNAVYTGLKKGGFIKKEA